MRGNEGGAVGAHLSCRADTGRWTERLQAGAGAPPALNPHIGKNPIFHNGIAVGKRGKY